MNVYESNKNEEYFPISPRIRRNRSTSTNIDLIDQSVKVSQNFASKLIKKIFWKDCLIKNLLQNRDPFFVNVPSKELAEKLNQLELEFLIIIDEEIRAGNVRNVADPFKLFMHQNFNLLMLYKL